MIETMHTERIPMGFKVAIEFFKGTIWVFYVYPNNIQQLDADLQRMVPETYRLKVLELVLDEIKKPSILSTG